MCIFKESLGPVNHVPVRPLMLLFRPKSSTRTLVLLLSSLNFPRPVSTSLPLKVSHISDTVFFTYSCESRMSLSSPQKKITSCDTVALGVDRALLVTCNQSDRALGETLMKKLQGGDSRRRGVAVWAKVPYLNKFPLAVLLEKWWNDCLWKWFCIISVFLCKDIVDFFKSWSRYPVMDRSVDTVSVTA